MVKSHRGKQVAGLVAGLTSEHATNFEEILSRLKVATGANSDADLAAKLGLTRSSISTAKTRGMVPPSWIVNAANLFNVSADWLIFGDEREPQNQPPTPPAPAPSPAITPQKKLNDSNKLSADQAMDLDEDDFESLWLEFWREKKSRRGWLQVEVIKRFPEFVKWLEQRPAPLNQAQIASLKKDEPTFHYGQPDQLDDD